jgi:hypothetical protein
MMSKPKKSEEDEVLTFRDAVVTDVQICEVG